jgi:hypothetical protein
MPAIASLVVKKADEATNITYDALVGAAGDTSQAVWRQDTGAVAGMPIGHRAVLTMQTTDNGPKSARVVKITYKRPYSTQNTTTSKYEATDFAIASISMTLPKAIPASEINESVHQFLNCVSTTLIKQSADVGYAPQ